ncbi:hypothetical protein RB653_007606 [Dictyostelium firmibasis]|uniref:SET domain-containing protein n=1 Tax=Dictyostelium firmibasis TaxID=79012 RepID=A0AAN7TUR1_9MYCE
MKRIFIFFFILFFINFFTIINSTLTEEESLNEFNKWLINNKVYKNPKIEIKVLEKYGRSIVAKQPIKKNEKLISVPKLVIMSNMGGFSHHLPSEIYEPSSTMGISPTNLQAIFLMYCKLNERSFWHPYVSVLPKQFTTSIYFSEEELDQLQSSKLKEFTIIRKDGIERHYNSTFTRLSNRGIAEFSPTSTQTLQQKGYTLELFTWALSCVWSRAFSLSDSDGGMVPLADMFNAEEISKSKVQPKVTDSTLDYYASDDIEIGEQIFTPYGVYKPLSSSQMLMDYGFVFNHGTPSDNVAITVPVFHPDEPNIQVKQAILEENEVENEVFLLTKKNPLPTELLLYARVKNLITKETKYAKIHFLSYQTKDQPLNVRNEKVSLRFLENLIHRYLDSYETTLDFDKSLIENSNDNNNNNNNLSFNSLNSIKIRISEKEILLSTLDAIEKKREKLNNINNNNNNNINNNNNESDS